MSVTQEPKFQKNCEAGRVWRHSQSQDQQQQVFLEVALFTVEKQRTQTQRSTVYLGESFFFLVAMVRRLVLVPHSYLPS